jgi:hypothetical protein
MFSPNKMDHLVEHPSRNLDLYVIFNTEACNLKSMSPIHQIALVEQAYSKQLIQF